MKKEERKKKREEGRKKKEGRRKKEELRREMTRKQINGDLVKYKR